MVIKQLVDTMLTRANDNSLTPLRLKDWDQLVKWEVDGAEYYWQSKDGQFVPVEGGEAGFMLKCSADTLQKIVDKKMPFFMALWAPVTSS